MMRDRFLLAFIIVYLVSWTTIAAFQPAPHLAWRGVHHLHAAVSKSGSKPNKSSTVSSGFGSRSSNSNTNSGTADPTKVRSLSGNTTPGAGSKVLANAANCFDRIRKIVGKDGTVDVYVRSPANDESTFWFVGKVVRVLEECCNNNSSKGDDDETSNDKVKPSSSSQLLSLTGAVYPTINEAIISQKRIILEYAKNELRPQNMAGPTYSKLLELWYAPGDSEMDVVRNAINLIPVIGSSKELREGFNVNDVGYNPEIYVGEEKVKGGLRVVRDVDGRPIKPIFDITV